MAEFLSGMLGLAFIVFMFWLILFNFQRP